MKAVSSLLLATILSAQSLSACPNPIPAKNCHPTQNLATKRFILNVTLKSLSTVLGASIGASIGVLLNDTNDQKWKPGIIGGGLGGIAGLGLADKFAHYLTDLIFPSNCEGPDEQKLPSDVLDSITDIPVPTPETPAPASLTNDAVGENCHDEETALKNKFLEEIRKGVVLKHVSPKEQATSEETDHATTTLYTDLLKEIKKHREELDSITDSDNGRDTNEEFND